MKVSKQFIDFLASWEGESLKAYKVPGENFYTIGVGHAREIDGEKITAGTTITKKKSRELLKKDLERFEEAVKKHVPYRWRRKRRHFETCVSLAFNMGEGILTTTPPLTTFPNVLRRPVNPANIKAAAFAIKLYNKGGNPLRVMRGLTRRRRAEAHLWLTGEYKHNN